MENIKEMEGCVVESIRSDVKLKEVQYLGNTLVVNANIKYIATTPGGRVYAFSEKPELAEESNTFLAVRGQAYCIGLAELENPEDWKKSLREVADPPEPKIVSLKNDDNYKKVKYFGEEFNVLEKIKYIATDRNGEIYGFGEGEIKINMKDGVFLSASTVGRRLGVLKLANPADWYKTLREV